MTYFISSTGRRTSWHGTGSARVSNRLRIQGFNELLNSLSFRQRSRVGKNPAYRGQRGAAGSGIPGALVGRTIWLQANHPDDSWSIVDAEFEPSEFRGVRVPQGRRQPTGKNAPPVLFGLSLCHVDRPAGVAG